MCVCSPPLGQDRDDPEGFGRDLMRAQQAVGLSSDPNAVVFALIRGTHEIDGHRIVYEDLLAMDLGDVLTLQSEVAGTKFSGPPGAFAALVHFGFGVSDLAAMDFDELSYWLSAVNEYVRAIARARAEGRVSNDRPRHPRLIGE